MRKLINGSEGYPFAEVEAPPGYKWKDSKKNIKIKIIGDTFKVYISDVNGGAEPALIAKDAEHIAGYVGLRTWSSSYSVFEDIAIEEH